MSQYYNILLTGGTSPGPYTIYYNQISNSNIATIYGLTLPATGVTLSQLILGFNVEVPDGTTSIIVFNTYCDTYQQIPVSDGTQTYEFCMTHRYLEGEYLIIKTHFIPNGLYNGQEAWISDSSTDGYQYSIFWDTTINQWRVSGQTGSQYVTQGCQYLSASSYPPFSGWYSIGCGTIGGLISVNENSCSTIESIVDFQASKTDATCECDGAITIVPTSGTPPFMASIDGGITYGGVIYTNLCSGTYTILVKDADDIISLSETIIIPPTYSPTTYTLSYTTTQSTNSVSPNSTTTTYITTFNVTPPLPYGVSINFDISHFNEFKSTPTPTSATRITNSSLVVDSIPITPTSTFSSDSTTLNTTPGCQDNSIYITGTTENWDNITIDNSTSIILSTITTLNFVNDICVEGVCNETYTINNITINGCSCCEVIIGG